LDWDGGADSGHRSLAVPIPRSERERFKAGGVSVGVETRREKKVSPFVSAAMILGGAGMMAAEKRKS
jgi:hypothetical protein